DRSRTVGESAATDALLFLLSWPRVPRNLHSFPTRRSSDLLAFQKQLFELPRIRVVEAQSGDFGDHGRMRDDACAEAALHQFPQRDRKSTRLNSSHVKSSYAVFCLKKKKHRTTPPSCSRVPA